MITYYKIVEQFIKCVPMQSTYIISQNLADVLLKRKTIMGLIKTFYVD